MKLTRIKPCSDCPFRKKALPGWLGEWKGPEEILQVAMSENGLPCHSAYKNAKVSIAEAQKTKHVCVGSLMCANNSFKIYRNPELAEMQNKVGKSDEALTEWDFITHHTRGNHA